MHVHNYSSTVGEQCIYGHVDMDNVLVDAAWLSQPLEAVQINYNFREQP